MCLARESEHNREDGTDAGRPSEGEGETDYERSQPRSCLLDCASAYRPASLDLEESGEVSRQMMTAPAMRASRVLILRENLTTSVEIAPSVMNTMLKPTMKAAELSITCGTDRLP